MSSLSIGRVAPAPVQKGSVVDGIDVRARMSVPEKRKVSIYFTADFDLAGIICPA